MKKIDIVCRRLRDVGIFFLGVAAITITIDLIWNHAHDPQRQTDALVRKYFDQGFEQAIAKNQQAFEQALVKNQK